MTSFADHLRANAAQQITARAHALSASREMSTRSRQQLVAIHIRRIRQRLEEQAFLLDNEGVTYGSWEFLGEDLMDDLVNALQNDPDLADIQVRRQRIDGVVEINLSL